MINMIHHRIPLLVSFVCLLMPVIGLGAGEQPERPSNNRTDMEKAVHLRNLVNDLLRNPNSTSIRKTIDRGGEQVQPLIDKALESKDRGESALKEKNYSEAADHFQTSLEHVIHAIRDQKDGSEGLLQSKLQDKLNANETFISAATRVVQVESNAEAVRMLKMAKDARIRAEADLNDGRNEQALAGLENSTRLAQQAIMLVRQGKVIERR